MFQYAWLLLSIVLVAGELLEDSQFPTIDRDSQEAAKYTSLRATRIPLGSVTVKYSGCSWR